MTRSNHRPLGERIGVGSRADLNDLLHPARAFAHPMDVVEDADLTISEKRSILAAWASDACAVEASNDCARTARPSSAGTTSWMRCGRWTGTRARSHPNRVGRAGSGGDGAVMKDAT
jgi:hypothetical protein